MQDLKKTCTPSLLLLYQDPKFQFDLKKIWFKTQLESSKTSTWCKDYIYLYNNSKWFIDDSNSFIRVLNRVKSDSNRFNTDANIFKGDSNWFEGDSKMI